MGNERSRSNLSSPSFFLSFFFSRLPNKLVLSCSVATVISGSTHNTYNRMLRLLAAPILLLCLLLLAAKNDDDGGGAGGQEEGTKEGEKEKKEAGGGDETL